MSRKLADCSKTCINPPRGRGEKRIGTLAGEDGDALDSTSLLKKNKNKKGLSYSQVTPLGDFIWYYSTTIVNIVPAEQGRKQLKLRHINFDPYPSRTHAGP